MTVLLGIVLLLVVLYNVTLYWETMALKNVTFTRSVDKMRVRIGDTVTLTTEVVNKKWLPLPWIAIHTPVPKVFQFKSSKLAARPEDDQLNFSIVTSLLFFEKVKRHDVFSCTARGYYSLYDFDVEIGDYFGFKKAKLKVKAPMVVMVYPEILPIKTLLLPMNSLMGEVSVKRWIVPDPLQPVGTRPYTPLDSFNTIDWKATARHAQMQVKQFDHTADPAIMVFLEVQSHVVHWQGRNEKAVERGIVIAASLVDDALAQGIPIGLCHNALDMMGKSGTVIEPSASKKQRQSLLDALTLTTPHRGTDMGELLRHKAMNLGKETVIVFIASFITEAVFDTLGVMAREGYHIKLISTDTMMRGTLSQLDHRIERLSVSDIVPVERRVSGL